MVKDSSVTKVKYIGEKDGMLYLEVALDGKCQEKDLFVCNAEQLNQYHPYGKSVYLKAATSKQHWHCLMGADTRSSSKSRKCASSATDPSLKATSPQHEDNFTSTTITSKIPSGESPNSASVHTKQPLSSQGCLTLPQCNSTPECKVAYKLEGSDRVMVKHPSKDRGCLLWTAVELAGFPGDILDVVVAEVKKRTCDEKHYDFKHISQILCHVGVHITDKQTEFLSGAVNKLELLIEQTDGLFAVTNRYHSLAVDCGRRLIFNCGNSYAFELSKSGFKCCNIFEMGEEEKIVHQIKRIIVDPHRHEAVCKIAGNKKALKRLKLKLSEL